MISLNFDKWFFVQRKIPFSIPIWEITLFWSFEYLKDDYHFFQNFLFQLGSTGTLCNKSAFCLKYFLLLLSFSLFNRVESLLPRLILPKWSTIELFQFSIWIHLWLFALSIKWDDYFPTHTHTLTYLMNKYLRLWTLSFLCTMFAIFRCASKL